MQGVRTNALESTPDLLGVLRARQSQAHKAEEPYVAPVVARDTMLFWLASAAKQARELAGRRQIHVAASADLDQSSVWRFEEHKSTPRDVDRMVAAYADDLDIDPMLLWDQALKLWREDRDQSPVSISTPDVRVAQTARAEAQRKRARREGARTTEAPSDAEQTGS